jgi:hypothetical protein
MKPITLSLTLLFFTIGLFAQTGTGTLEGKIIDDSNGEPLLFATITLHQMDSAMLIQGMQTDFDGNFSFKNVEAGKYDLEIFYVGYNSARIEKIQIYSDKITRKDIALLEGITVSEVVVTEYAVPLISPDKTTTGKTITSSDIRNLPSKSISGIAATTAGVTSSDDGLSIRGSRSSGDIIYIDGIRASKKNKHRARKLTAGEINDFSKWEMWQDIAENELNKWQKVWNMRFSNRYTVQVINKKGVPIVDSKVELFNNKTLLWTSKTDNTGKAELWENVFGEETESDLTKLSIIVTNNDIKHKIKKVKEFKDGINFLEIRSRCKTHSIVDIAFVVDATSSMSDEINYLKAELEDVILQMKTKTQDEINLGSVFYRDIGDEYVTRKSSFSTKISTTIDFISNQSAAGGGDGPEAVDMALDMAINEMDWSENAATRLLFLVLDAPPHQNPEVLKKLELVTKKAAEKGIRIIPITASGVDKSTEYLMRSLALSTNGTYTFLTNHSGIGNNHIEPTTDSYKVELLNDLLVRLFVQYTQTFDCEVVEVDSLEVFELQPMAVTNPIISNDSIPIEINCFPNPTKGQLTIESNKTFEEVFITDANGKIIQRHLNLEIGNNRINLNNFPSGLYFLRYIKNGESGTKKIVVLH